MQSDGSPEIRPSVSWADKARSHTHRATSNSSNELGQAVTPPELELVEEEDISRQILFHGIIAPICTIPIDTWDIISRFLSFSEVQTVSSTCRYLWLHLHSRNNIWQSQLMQFRHDMDELRGDKRPLHTDFLDSPKQSAYERIKLERRLYTLDIQREWYIRDLELPYQIEGIVSYPLTLDDNTVGAGDNALDTDVAPLTQIRILRPVLETSLNHSDASSGTANEVEERATFTPSEYMLLCDSINQGDFTSTRILIRDCTMNEDELFLFSLLQTLRLAKSRPTTQRSQNAVRTSRHRILRYFGGILIPICRVEAEQILGSLLYMPNLLEYFVICKDLVHRDQGNLMGRFHTRYFIAPEMCRHRRVGLVIVDSVRLMVIMGKERYMRDDPRWDEEHTSAAAEGRAVRGTGMNPQNRRRPL